MTFQIIRNVIAVAVFFCAQQVSAAIVYGDNAGNNHPTASVVINQVGAADDFNFTGPTLVTGVTMWVTSFGDAAELQARLNAQTYNLDYIFLGDAGGLPSFGLFETAGNAQNLNAVLTSAVYLPGILDLPVLEVTYELMSPWLFDAGTYWLLSSSSESLQDSPDFTWLGHSVVGNFSVLDDTGSRTFVPQDFDLAFQLLGPEESQVPLPSVAFLLLLGLLLLRLIRAN